MTTVFKDHTWQIPLELVSIGFSPTDWYHCCVISQTEKLNLTMDQVDRMEAELLDTYIIYAIKCWLIRVSRIE